jgi:hypothetical protein
MKILTRRRWLAAADAVAVVASAVGATVASAGAGAATANPGSLGPISGLLPRDHLTLESAIQVNLSKESIRLPLYPGTAYAGTPQVVRPGPFSGVRRPSQSRPLSTASKESPPDPYGPGHRATIQPDPPPLI